MSRSASLNRPDSESDVDSSVDARLKAIAARGAPSGNAEAEYYMIALMESQEQVGKLKAQVKTLQAENYELKLQAARKSGAARGKAKSSSPMPSSSVNSSISASGNTDAISDKAAVAIIRRFGRYAQLVCSPLLPTFAFGEPKPSFHHESPERYEATNVSRGFTADVYYCVPQPYHEKIANGSVNFRTCFLDGCAQELANCLFTLRSVSGELIGVSQSFFRSKDPSADDYISRATVPRIRELLGITTVLEKDENGENVTKDVYSEFPPLLYHPSHVGDVKFMFQNPLLFQFAKAIIFGQSNINHPAPKLRSTATYRHSDGRPLRASSGIIAYVPAMLQYALSPDSEFGGKGVGDITGIDYGITHARYRRILIEGRNKSTIRRVFRLWNENVFVTTRGADSDESAPEDEEDRIETQRQARDGVQPREVIHNILAGMSDSDDSDLDNAPARANLKGKGVDRDATLTLENLSISSSRPATPRTRPSTPIAESGKEARADLDVDPYYIASSDLRPLFQQPAPPRLDSPPVPIVRAQPLMRRTQIVSARQSVAKAADPAVADQAGSISAAGILARTANLNVVAPPVIAPPVIAPPVVPTPTSTVIAPAPCRSSNRGKAAQGTSDVPTGQAAGQSSAVSIPVAVRGRGGKAVSKKTRGA